MNQVGTLSYQSGNHTGYVVSSDVVNTIVKKWRGNRDPDSTRVIEIKEYMVLHVYVPVISVALLDGNLLCYDGNHRREAILMLNDATPVLLDVLYCPQGENDIIREFIALNKTVPVSELHLATCTSARDSSSAAVKVQILDLVKSYEARFRRFASTSHRCNAPNFNRDRFTDNIYALHRASGCSVDDIAAALEKLNVLYSPTQSVAHTNHPVVNVYRAKTLPDRIREKCVKGGLWLFAWHHDIPLQDVQLCL